MVHHSITFTASALALAALLLTTTVHAQNVDQSLVSLDPYANETTSQRDERMAWFRDAKFGLFIHWGVYTVPAGTHDGKPINGGGEWILLRGKIPLDQYKTYAQQFNPTQYDPDAWVRLAKQAGMKYIVITAKHHDGFALFDSKASEWDVVDATPYGKDLIKPLAEACRKHGLKLGFYYSQAQDWVQGGNTDHGPAWDPAQPTDMDQYLREIAAPQVKEILSNYGDIAVLWWDTNWGMDRKRSDLLIPMLSLQPGIIHNNRLGGGYQGDIQTPEQHIPGTGLPGDWESCMTMNRTWGFKSYDDQWKSPQTLIRNLIDIASKGGNYLLNVGPTAQGVIPPPSIERLQAMGLWMDTHSDAIYGTTASPCRIPDWGRITTKLGEHSTTLYLHVFDWKKNGEIFLPVDNTVQSCRLLTDPKQTFTAQHHPGRGITVTLAGDVPNPNASVIELIVDAAPVRSASDYLAADDQGVIALPLSEAVIEKPYAVKMRYDAQNQEINRWTDDRAQMSWEFRVQKPGRFTLELATHAQDDTVLLAQVDGQTVQSHIARTGSTFARHTLPPIMLSTAGIHHLKLLPVEGQWTPLRLKSATLRPFAP